MTYHINDEGNPGPCKALVRCPFGDINDDHYDTVEQARAAFEAKNARATLPPSYTPSAPAQKLLDKLTVKPNFGSYFFTVTPKELAAVPYGEWSKLVGTLRIQEEQDRNRLNALQAQNTHPNEIAKAAVKTNTSWVRFNVARKALTLMQPRKERGVQVPAGYAIVPCVYDLDGNLLGPAKDTRTSPQKFTLKDGSKLTYRESRAQNPHDRVESNRNRGFYTGAAAVPVGLTIDHRSGVRVKPAYTAVRDNPDLAIHVDTGAHATA